MVDPDVFHFPPARGREVLHTPDDCACAVISLVPADISLFLAGLRREKFNEDQAAREPERRMSRGTAEIAHARAASG
jgi:hypothetical protein